ncbi:DUF6376 family protein [Paenibacillus sp. GCM10027627]|uniref:DUF6376 family protein n=1 Tax=unclassified Paenibacillus TaxID=185978 RepID=UPI00362EB1E3
MKKIAAVLFFVMTLGLASGCGILDGAQQSVNFATETTNYMNSLTTFGQDMNGLAEQALTDIEARTDLKARLVELKEQVVQYADIQVPDYAKDLHGSIVQYNEKLQQGLDQALTNIEQGRAAFESTGIPDTITKINDLLGQINQLGG